MTSPTIAHLRHAAAPVLERIRRDRSQAPPRLVGFLAYLEEHIFDSGLSVSRIKEECGIGDNSLLMQFTSALGRTPWAYIEDRRLETACRLLTRSRLKIVRIAEILGYSSLQVFSRAFTRWSGERPSKYRGRGNLANPRPQPKAAPSAPLRRRPVERIKLARLIGEYPCHVCLEDLGDRLFIWDQEAQHYGHATCIARWSGDDD